MKLSIIIVNYNTRKITLNCLKSIEKHPYKEKFEVYLVDNGSTDGSVDTFRKFKPRKFKFVFIENGKNLGFSKANNIGIKKSKGEYKLLLNSDTLLKDNALDKLMKFALNHPDSGIIAPRLLNEDLSIQPSVFRLPTLLRTIRQYWFNEKGLLDKYAPSGKESLEVEAVVGAAFLITPLALKKVGYLNEKYFMFFEDLDYCREVRKANLKIYYLPFVEVIHLHGKSGQNISENKDQWRRLIPGSKIYHGKVVHYLRWFVMRISQVFNNA